jgi:HK97 family phage major capsid protein
MGEKQSPVLGDNSIQRVQLTPKRFATAIELSEQFVLDTGLDNVYAHIENVLIERLIAGIEDQITINGGFGTVSATQLRVIHRGGNGAEYISANVKGPVEFSKIKTAVGAVKGYKNGFWIFNQYPEVVDEAGNNMVNYQNNSADGSIGTLMGMPIYRAGLAFWNPTETTSSELACVLVTEGAYTLMLSDMKIRALKQGSAELMKGVIVFEAEVYADGEVTNSSAVRGIEYKAQPY